MNQESCIEHTLRTLLPVLEKDEVNQLLEQLSNYPVEVIKEPETGLIMAHARDCFDVDFYLGELLATTAEVECFGVRGHATIMGDELLKAILAATVNAIMRSPQANTLTELSPLFEVYMQKFRHLRQQESQLTAATKVNFESMAKET
jgi:phosphonate C-P lyase system protein PhnG